MDINVHYDNKNQITHFDGKIIKIGENSYCENIMITNDIVDYISMNSIEELDEKFILDIVATKPDIVIFGTGNKIKYPNQKLLKLLHKNNIGFEVMAIAPLCRTYNFLLSEDRKVVALVIFDKD